MIVGSLIFHFGIIFGSYWGRFGICLVHFEVVLVSSWGHLGVRYHASWRQDAKFFALRVSRNANREVRHLN